MYHNHQLAVEGEVALTKNPNSRPDIQVLEERVVRLKTQIEEFQQIRLYSVSKQRLARVGSELEDCISMIDEIVGDTLLTPASSSATYYDSSESLSEFSINDDTDLNDSLLLPSSDSDRVEVDSRDFQLPHYSAKFIVSTYSHKLQDCADTVGCSSGVIQVNQFSQLLNSWYQTRFTPTNVKRNPKFLFKADKICDWIDLLMIAAGNSIHLEMFPAFISDMHTWIDTLNTVRDPGWALPYSVMQIKKSYSSCCTQEAVLLEKMLKPSLYDESFYIHNIHSIEDIYIDSFGGNRDDLQLENIIHNCPKLTITSSFDAGKYYKRGN